MAETVRIVRKPCRFGGTRPYFICPGIVNGMACGRRVAKLHGPGRYFLCRSTCGPVLIAGSLLGGFHSLGRQKSWDAWKAWANLEALE